MTTAPRHYLGLMDFVPLAVNDSVHTYGNAMLLRLKLPSCHYPAKTAGFPQPFQPR